MGTNSKNGFFGDFFDLLTGSRNVPTKGMKTRESNESGCTADDETRPQIVTGSAIEIKSQPVYEPLPNRKVVCISKTGSDHLLRNKNNQDYAFHLLNMKIVIDGCGSCKHSEVGARLFSQLFARKAKKYLDKGEPIDEKNFNEAVNGVFQQMLSLCDDDAFILNNYCFTILACFELEDEFVVFTCGDGFIIKEDESGIYFDEIDSGQYPAYYAYNFIQDKSSLVEYQDGVNFWVIRIPKSEYFNVGVSSDGLRFWDNLLYVEKMKLYTYLHEGKGPQLEKLINRNNLKNGMFHDDISICF